MVIKLLVSNISIVLLNQSLSFLAFPSVGCGKLGFDPALIAQHMISAAIKHLKTSKVQLELSFVLIPSQQNVYDEFVKYLNKLSQPSTASPTLTTNRNLKMPFTETSKILSIKNKMKTSFTFVL